MPNDIALGELFRIGSSKRVLKSQWQAEGVPFYRGREVTRLAKDGFVNNELYISEELYSDYADKYGVPTSGDIVITAIGTIGNSYIVRDGDRFYFKDASVLWLKKTSDVSSEFINLWLKSPVFWGQLDKGNGATVDTLTIKKLQSVTVNLPPVKEQKRIAAILDEAFAGISQAVSNAEKNLANARELFESYLNNIFTQKGEVRGESTISEISTVINGYAFKSGDFSDQNTVKSIKITNVGVKEFVVDESNLLPGDFCKRYDKVAIPEGSIVIALTRSIISSGFKVTVVPVEYDGALLNQRVAALISKSDIVLSQYLYFYLCSTNVIEYVKKNVNTLMQPNLSITDLKSLPVPIPSLENQVEIVENLKVMERQAKKLNDIYQKKLTALTELKQSILQKAFSGELSVDTVKQVVNG